MVSLHPAMFGGHWSNASGYITYLICYMTLSDGVIERSCSFFGGSSSLYVVTVPSLVVISIVVVEI